MKKIVCSLAALTFCAVTALAQVPHSKHVVMVLEENHSYGQVIGNASMPYLNSLAKQYGLAVNYYANTHPSIGNYFMLTTGQIITNNDGYSSTVTANNLVRAMLTAGVTWKSYAESLPYTGYTGGDVYPYVRHHNPFAYFSDVRNSSTEKNYLVPFTHFATDLANHTLPNFSFVVPNMHHNMHDCPTSQTGCTDAQKAAAADQWLKANIAPLLANSDFQQDGILIITWDEGTSSDTAHGGGRVATVVVGPRVKSAYKSSTFGQEQNLLRTVVDALGITNGIPGAAASAAPVKDFFVSDGSGTKPCVPGPGDNTVTICSPGTSSNSPLAVSAAAMSSSKVVYMAVWLDGVKKYECFSDSLSTNVPTGSGTHRLTVQAKNSAGTYFKTTEYVTVQ